MHLPLLDLPTLTFACVAMLALSAVALALFAFSTRTYRGFWWWVLAQALLATGTALIAQRDAHPLLQPLLIGLILQWPVTMLAGLRRHFGRHEWRTRGYVDAGLLLLAFGAWFVSWLVGAPVALRVVVYSAGAIVLHLYAAWLVSRLHEFSHTLALKAFASTALLNAAYQLWRIATFAQVSAAEPFPQPLLLGGAILLVITSISVSCFALLLTAERTEANLLVTQRHLRVLADVDMLTGMANRRHFLESADALLATSRNGRDTVLMFDIDHFKQVNDLLGHAVGDEALRQIALCVRDTLRERDMAGRLGGDEFAVLLPDTAVGDAMAVAARIVSRLEHRQVAPRVARLSLSFGVVQTKPGESIVDALRRADQALYEAKRQGRSRAVEASGDAEQPVFGESRPMGLSAL